METGYSTQETFYRLGVEPDVTTVEMIGRLSDLRAAGIEVEEPLGIKSVCDAMLNDLRNYSEYPDPTAFYEKCLSAVTNVPLSEGAIRVIDETLYEAAISSLTQDDDLPHVQAAAVTLSLYFAAETPYGQEKVERIVGDLLDAKKKATSFKAKPSERAGARKLEAALQEYLRVGGITSRTIQTPSQASQAVQAGKESLQERAKLAREQAAAANERAAYIAAQAAELARANGKKVVTTMMVGAVASTLAPMSAAAETPENLQTIVVSNQQGADAPRNAVRVEVGDTGTVAVEEAYVISSTQKPETARVRVQVGSVDVNQEMEPLIVSTAATQTETARQTVQVAVGVGQETEAQSEPLIIKEEAPVVENERVAVQPMAVTPEEIEDYAQNIEVPVPDNNVNLKPEETPQQLIDRLVNSRDLSATSHAIRQTYGIAGVEAAPVNETLVAVIGADVSNMATLISEAKHSDAAYTERGFRTLAFLDAAVRNPTILDKPEVAEFVNSLPEQGEEYHNKLYAQYLAEAGTYLAKEESGKFEGYSEAYQTSIKTMYAYTALAAVSDEKQNEQINAIKAEEARIAEEARKAAEEEVRKQAIANGEIVATPESQMMITAIDRAMQNGSISERYGYIMKRLISVHGASFAGASGMIGNCMAEADGCNPAIEERGNFDRRKGLGIFQWTDPIPGQPGRRTAIENAAKAAGVDVTNLDFQIDYAVNESRGRDSRDRTGNEWEQLNALTDPAAAAEYWRWNFERPQDHLNSTNTRIRVAQEVFGAVSAQLEAVRAEDAARVAAEQEAARKAAEEAERQAAEAAERHGEMTSGKSMFFDVYARYDGKSGMLSGDELVGFEAQFPNGRGEAKMQPEAARQFQRLNAAFVERFGVEIMITSAGDSYRSFERQVTARINKPGEAARPGTSNHGWGLAADWSGLGGYGGEKYQWLLENAPNYGWTNPEWARQGGSGTDEPWHWEYLGSDIGKGYQGLIVDEAHNHTGIKPYRHPF